MGRCGLRLRSVTASSGVGMYCAWPNTGGANLFLTYRRPKSWPRDSVCRDNGWRWSNLPMRKPFKSDREIFLFKAKCASTHRAAHHDSCTERNKKYVEINLNAIRLFCQNNRIEQEMPWKKTTNVKQSRKANFATKTMKSIYEAEVCFQQNTKCA